MAEYRVSLGWTLVVAAIAVGIALVKPSTAKVQQQVASALAPAQARPQLDQQARDREILLALIHNPSPFARRQGCLLVLEPEKRFDIKQAKLAQRRRQLLGD